MESAELPIPPTLSTPPGHRTYVHSCQGLSHMCLYLVTCKGTCISSHMRISIYEVSITFYVHAYVGMHMDIDMCTYIHMHIYIYTYVNILHIYIYIRIYQQMHIPMAELELPTEFGQERNADIWAHPVLLILRRSGNHFT